MAKNGNGTWWKILMWAAGGLVAAGIALASIGTNTQRINRMEPEVQKNSEHRLQDEVDTRYVKEKIASIEAMQKQILQEVKK